MYRSEKSSSKVCTSRTRKKNYDRHRARLKNIKPSIDTGAPKKFPHLKRNLKKLQTEQEHYEKVNYENQILLNKMTDIFNQKYIDNENKNMRYFRSLDRGAKNARKRQLDKINYENHAILQRILHRQPVYSHLDWKQARSKNKTYCRNICQYPYVLPGTAQGKRKKRRRRVQHRQPEPPIDEDSMIGEEEEPVENLDEMLLEADKEQAEMLAEEQRLAEEEEEARKAKEEQQAEEEKEEEATEDAAPEDTTPEKKIQKSGELSITIVSVSDINKGGDLFSKPDPYVKVILGKQKKQTKTKKSTTDPEFNETFKLSVEDCEKESVTLELFEDDFITSDDKLGNVTIPLGELLQNEEKEMVLNLEDCKSKETTIKVVLNPTFGVYNE